MIIKRFRHYKNGLIIRLDDKEVRKSNPNNKYLVTLPEGKVNLNGDNSVFTLTVEDAKDVINQCLFT